MPRLLPDIFRRLRLRPVKVVKVRGGLGNQMFQYVFGQAMTKRLKATVHYDTSFYRTQSHRRYELGPYRLDETYASASELSEYQTHSYQERSHAYDPGAFQATGAKFSQGYWQCEKCFCAHRKKLLAAFRPRWALHPGTLALLQRMEGETVSLHVRRGDYVEVAEAKGILVPLPTTYYRNAVRFIEKRHGPVQYFIFSDDPA